MPIRADKRKRMEIRGDPECRVVAGASWGLCFRAIYDQADQGYGSQDLVPHYYVHSYNNSSI